MKKAKVLGLLFSFMLLVQTAAAAQDLYPSKGDVFAYSGGGLMLLVLGFVLLLIEVFVPGFGIFGIGGIICLGSSVYFLWGSSGVVLYLIAGIIAAMVVIVFLIVKFLPQNPLWNVMVLKNQQKTQDGYSSSANYKRYLGKHGKALTPFRPSGTALIEGERVDVVTEGEFLSAGVELVVVKVEGSRIIVREVK